MSTERIAEIRKRVENVMQDALLGKPYYTAASHYREDVPFLLDESDKLERINQRLVDALKAYMFIEQTNGGLNPHPPGTNKHRAFELGRAALRAAGE